MLLMNPWPQNLPRCPVGLMEELLQTHKALDVSGTEALHSHGAAPKAMPGSLGNSRSINIHFHVSDDDKKTKQQC